MTWHGYWKWFFSLQFLSVSLPTRRTAEHLGLPETEQSDCTETLLDNFHRGASSMSHKPLLILLQICFKLRRNSLFANWTIFLSSHIVTTIQKWEWLCSRPHSSQTTAPGSSIMTQRVYTRIVEASSSGILLFRRQVLMNDQLCHVTLDWFRRSDFCMELYAQRQN